MITFKDHMSVSKGLSVSDDGMVSIDGKSLLERIEWIREIEETYPLANSKRITPFIEQGFDVYSSVKKMVLGQFIMVEQILTGKQKFSSDVDMELALLKLILRPKHHKEFDNTDYKEEEAHEDTILNSPVQDCYNILNRFLNDREKTLFKEFAGVFYEVNEDTGEEEEKVEKSSDTGAEFHSQWYWYSIVRMLAKEDILNHPKIYMLAMREVLPEMSYLAQKNKVESAQRRQEAALSKL